MTVQGGNWTIALGATMAFVGLCCVPGGLEKTGDPSVLALGATIFSLGALVAAGGIYLRARAMQTVANEAAFAEAARRARGGCELCASDVPVIECRVHQLHLCATCLAQHYDPRSCSYVPPAKRTGGKPGKALARARGAS